MERKVEMQTSFGSDQPTPDELIKLIRKLRWIGLEEEARQLQLALSRFPPDRRAILPATPIECD